MGIGDRVLGTLGKYLGVIPVSFGTRIYTMQTGLISANTEVSVFTGTTLGGILAGQPIEVIGLEIAFDHDADLRVLMQPRAKSGGVTLMNVVAATGLNYQAMTVNQLRPYGHSLIELTVDNPTSGTGGPGQYKINLKPGVTFPMHNGGDITVKNISTTTDHNAVVEIIVKELS